VYLSARNLALAAKNGLTNLLIPCNECHFMTSEAQARLEQDARTRGSIEALLAKEGLALPKNIRIWHTVDLLHDFIGLEAIKAKVVKPLTDLTFAVHPGCQIIRPSDIGRPDDPEAPKKLDRLVEALGATTVAYSEKLDCCGAALLYSHADSALSLSGLKLKAVQAYGVDGLVDTCPYCHTLFDGKQKEALATVGVKSVLPTFYYTQLLGLALGAKREDLGLHLNQTFNPEDFTD
jgi:heterodisulfide reductase subunit B